MLGKLIKYEFKACGRTFFPLYMGILLLATINGLCNNYNVFKLGDNGTSISFSIVNLQGILMLVLFALFVALFVITIVFTIQRFKKNLLENEGYLMFTLPVSSKSLILSKYIVSIIFIILSTLVAIISFIFVGLFSGNINFMDLANIMGVDIFNIFTTNFDFWKFIIIIMFCSILMYSIFIFTIYLAISVGQFPQFNKYRVVSGIIAFFVINTVISYVQSLIYKYLSLDSIIIPESISNTVTISISGNDIFILVLNILIAVILFMGTDWILNKKLNLE